MQIGGKQMMWIIGIGVGGFLLYKHFKKPAAAVPVPAAPLPVPGAPVPGSPLPIPQVTYPQSTVPQIQGQYASPYGGLVPQAGTYPSAVQQGYPGGYPYSTNIIPTGYPLSVTGGSPPGMLAGFAGYAN